MITNKEKTKLVKKFNERFADIQRKLGQGVEVVRDYVAKIGAVLGSDFLDKSASGNLKIKTDFYSKLDYSEEALQKLLHELPTFGQLKYKREQEEGRKLTTKEAVEKIKEHEMVHIVYDWLLQYVDPSSLWSYLNKRNEGHPAHFVAWKQINEWCKDFIREHPNLRKLWNAEHPKEKL